MKWNEWGLQYSVVNYAYSRDDDGDCDGGCGYVSMRRSFGRGNYYRTCDFYAWRKGSLGSNWQGRSLVENG